MSEITPEQLVEARLARLIGDLRDEGFSEEAVTRGLAIHCANSAAGRPSNWDSFWRAFQEHLRKHHGPGALIDGEWISLNHLRDLGMRIGWAPDALAAWNAFCAQNEVSPNNDAALFRLLIAWMEAHKQMALGVKRYEIALPFFVHKDGAHLAFRHVIEVK